MKFVEIFLSIVEAACALQKDNGEMPSGCNGPHGHIETPVRTTSHWAISFIKAYKLTNERKYYKSAQKCKNYLIKFPHPYRKSDTFIYRTAAHADRCNGLIGTAWTLESLIACYRFFGDEKCLQLAEKLFLLHPFNLKTFRWSRVECDGRILSEDMTFNHQLWFCAAALPLVKLSRELKIKSPEIFLKNLNKNMTVRNTGCIVHTASDYPRDYLKKLKFIFSKKYRAKLEEKEWGYHFFNTHALGMIKSERKNGHYLETKNIKKSIQLLSSSMLKTKALNNAYSYPYNPPGFEVPYSLYAFSCSNWLEEAEFWLNQQIGKTFSSTRKDLSQNTTDPVTLTARIYEVCNLPEEFFDIRIRLGD